MPLPTQDFSTVVDTDGVIYIQISDLNTPFYNENGYERLAMWIQANKFKKVILMGTGTLQVDSMQLNEELAGKQIDQSKLLQKGRKLERRTLSKLLNKLDPLTEKKGNTQYDFLRVKPRNEKICTPTARRSTKSSLKQEKTNSQIEKKQATIARFIKSTKLSNDLFLSDDFQFSHFFMNPLNEDVTTVRRRHFLLYIPWSAVVDENFRAQSYKRYKDEFEYLLEEGDNLLLFQTLADKTARARLAHYYEKNKGNIALSQSEWENENFPKAQARTTSYLKKEIPFFLMQIVNALEIHAATGKVSYFCYPMQGSLGADVFEYTTQLFTQLSPHVTMDHRAYFKYVDITDLLLNKTNSNDSTLSPARPAPSAPTMTSKRQHLLLLLPDDATSNFITFLHHASEPMINDLWECRAELEDIFGYDEQALFLSWLQANNLLISPALTNQPRNNRIDTFKNMHLLSTAQGIFFLNQTVLNTPIETRQDRLNTILQKKRNNKTPPPPESTALNNQPQDPKRKKSAFTDPPENRTCRLFPSRTATSSGNNSISPEKTAGKSWVI